MINILRKYKLTYQIFNFFKKSQLMHNVQFYKKYGLSKKYFSSISSLDFINIKSEKNIYDASNSLTEMPKSPKYSMIDEGLRTKLLPWSEKGYVVLDNFFDGKEIDRINKEVENLIKSEKVKFRYKNKIMFAINKSSTLFDFGANKKLIDILNFLLGKDVELFQSINFLTGSQQRTHSDSIHMTTFPYGNLIAAWVALEDISIDSGPLHYYPGTNNLPYIMNKDFGNSGSKHKLGNKTYADYEDHIESIVKKHNLKKEVFLAKKGDVFIWHANLLHGGEPVLNKESSRKSMVFHYYAKKSICFHEVTQRPTLKKLNRKAFS